MTDAPSANLLDAALAHAGQGRPVFPCHPDTKRPLVEHGFKEATANPASIRAWWAKWPAAMIGMPTGAASGVWVLDIDDPEQFEAACPVTIPPTRRCETGKGYHLYFTANGSGAVTNAQRNRKGWPFPEMPGAEVRAEGGYVILPPSMHPSGRAYRWSCEGEPVPAPAELLRIVRKEGRPRPARNGATNAASGAGGHDSRYGLAALDDECAAIRLAMNGAQEQTLNEAALKIGALVAGGELTSGTARARLIAAGLDMTSHNARECWTHQSVMAKVERALRDGAASPRRAPESERARFDDAAGDDFDPETGELHEPGPIDPPGGDEAAKPSEPGDSKPKAAKREKRPNRAGEVDVSEDMIAQAFTARYGPSLRFDRDRGRWFEWDGTRWCQDELERAFHYARELARNLGDGERGVGKASFAKGAEAFARADPVHAVTSATWDADTMLLGTPGGTVDLRTGRLRAASRADFITRQTAVAPDSAPPARWLQFLDEALSGDAEVIAFLQRWCGYCLTGETIAHALVFIYGPGGNGKSVFQNTISAILGDYAVTATMQTFTASRNERHLTELAMLKGARLVTASETEEGKRFAEARIKQLTGSDPVTANFMRQDHFTYLPQFKLMISGNHMPQLASVDEAMRRRLNLVPFINKPERVDDQLEAKLREEHGRILAWCIQGCLAWQHQGPCPPAAVSAATDSYFEDQDLFGQWLAECCERDPRKWELPTPLYQSWCRFAKEAGDDPGSMKDFKPRLERRSIFSAKTNGLRIYRGVCLRADRDAGTGGDA